LALLSLILVSTFVDYLVAIQLGTRKDKRLRKLLLVISCSLNLASWDSSNISTFLRRN